MGMLTGARTKVLSNNISVRSFLLTPSERSVFIAVRIVLLVNVVCCFIKYTKQIESWKGA